MPAESGLAYVVVMHLSPEHESNLASILQQKTAMPVTQVTEPVKVQPNHVYVIPPNNQLAFEDGRLQLVEPQQAIGRRVTIDLFFRTLAHAYGQRAVCIVLSGTDSDGVIGLKHIRAQGGVTVAQDPKEAQHDSMPLSAISTGMVDWVLPVAEMPPKLMELVQNERRMRLPPEVLESETADEKVRDAPGGETVAAETRESPDENALREVLTVLRRQTGHDFTHYKRATAPATDCAPDAGELDGEHPGVSEFLRGSIRRKRDELLHDLLIGVTAFFPRPRFLCFTGGKHSATFRREIKRKTRFASGRRAVRRARKRIRSRCCSASMRSGWMRRRRFRCSRATWTSSRSTTRARDSIRRRSKQTFQPERLRRFFAKDHGLYRVRKSLREKVLFAAHNLLNDAPFLELDLVSCRNLLIYLNAESTGHRFRYLPFFAPGRRAALHRRSGKRQQCAFAFLARGQKASPLCAPLRPPPELEDSSRSRAGARSRRGVVCAHTSRPNQDGDGSRDERRRGNRRRQARTGALFFSASCT